MTTADRAGGRRQLLAASLFPALIASGCASGGVSPGVPDAPGAADPAPQGGPAGAAQSYARVAAPFPVFDEAGEPYEIPFLGGFNVPRPQWVDIDGDGDLDLFVQERTGQLLFFEREDTPDGRTHSWHPGAFSELDVGEWYRFVDVDGDGDRDLLAESPFSYLKLYRNNGSAGRADFELVADTLKDTRNQPIFSDRQNIPNAADMDCDERLDLLIGRLVGTVTRYEATGVMGANASPFRHVTDRFEDIEIVADPAAQGAIPFMDGAGPGARPTIHGANTMALADYDADGDTDMFWGDFFEAGLLLIENIGSCEAPNLRVEPEPFPLGNPIRTSGYNAPTFGDYDGDGDLDLLMGVLGGAYNANTTTADNLMLFSQEADGGFELRTSRFVSQIDVGSESVPSLVDLDADGDLDLLLGNKIDPDDLSNSRVFLFENEGSATQPAFRRKGEFPLPGAYHNAPAFGDLDGDGDLDILLGSWRDELRYIRNEGTATEPRFALVDSAFVEITRGSNTAPALGDLDGDGDLDLMVGESSGTLNYFENTGSPAAPRFELRSDEYGQIDVGRRSFPKLIDLDGDGDLDMVVGTEAGGIRYFRNEGGAASFSFVEADGDLTFLDEAPLFVTPEFGDLDGDGDLDLVTGGAGGGAYYFERG